MSGLVADRWRTWLTQLGRATHATGRRVIDRSQSARIDGQPELFLREVYARAGLEERRSLDLLLAILVEVNEVDEIATEVAKYSEASVLHVVGPEAIRAKSGAGTSGFVVNEIGLGQATPDMRVSLVLLRIDRASRARDVAASIESLGRLLDYDENPEASTAIAHRTLRRLEVLTAGTGVRVSVAGTYSWASGEAALQGTLHLLTDVSLALDDELEYRDGRLMVVSSGEASSSVAVSLSRRRGEFARERRGWTGGDYALLRIGYPIARRVDEGRPLQQRRVEHGLAEVSLGSAITQDAGSYSSRAASGRQAARAQEILEGARATRQQEAATQLAAALSQPGAQGPLIENVVGGVDTVADFWTVLPVVERTLDNLAADTGPRHIATLLLTRLGERFDQMLRLGAGDSSEPLIPVTTPIVLEVSDTLVPIVDQNQDDGHFLYELIPAMRNRIGETTGVWIPGVRARGNGELARGGFSVQIDEVPVVEGILNVGGGYRVLAPNSDIVATEIDEVNPLTGEPGRWLIAEAPAEVATITAAHYLAHRVGAVIHSHLSAFLGLHEVTALVDRWRATDPETVRRVVGSQVAVERLALLLQGLVGERIAITDWRAILDAVLVAGGFEVPLGVLHQAVRTRLRAVLPGPRTGPAAVEVPSDIQAELATEHAANRERARLIFLTWLRGVIDQQQSVVSLVTNTSAVRVAVAALARSEKAVVFTFTTEEVTAG